jgi:hypothetical protein
VHAAVMQDIPDLSGWQVYACGAPVMVDAARSEYVAQCGLPAEEFFADAFTTEADLARNRCRGSIESIGLSRESRDQAQLATSRQSMCLFNVPAFLVQRPQCPAQP